MKRYQLLVAVVNTKVMFHVASTTIRTVFVCVVVGIMPKLAGELMTLLALKKY